MHLSPRRKFGLVVIGLTVLAAILVLILSDHGVEVSNLSAPRPPKSGDYLLPTMVIIHVASLDTAIPIAGCALLGFLLFAWPERKPPRIDS
jgi:hypothetical protein